MLTDLLEKTRRFLARYPRFIAVVTVSVGVVWILGTAGLQASWYNSTGSDNQTWDHRQKITIQASEVDSTLSDFPVYVDLSDLGSQFFNSVQADGADIRVTTSNGATEVAREVVSVDTASSTGELHFKAPSISASQDSEFYIYYGNDSASNYATSSTYGRNAVWSNNYFTVFHFNDPAVDGGTVEDSTGNYDATMTGTDWTSVDGQTGSALELNMTDGSSYILMPSIPSEWAGVQNLTLTLFGRNTTDQDKGLFWSNQDGSASNWGVIMEQWNDGNMYFQSNNPSNSISIDGYDNNYHVYHMFFDGTLSNPNRLRAYRDGADTGASNNSVLDHTNGSEDSNTSTDAPNFGLDDADDTDATSAIYDEARGSSVSRSDGWMAAESSNLNTPSTFYSIGSQQTQAGSNVAFGDNPDGDYADPDWDYRKKITIDQSQVSSALSDFPVYVDLSNLGSHFFSNTAPTCGDIRVTDGDGDEIPREVVACDTTGETGELHFRASTIYATQDTEFYIYYGNTDANDYVDSATYGAENVWTNGYAAVYHMDDDPSVTAPQILDSTANNNHGTTSGSMVSGDSISGRLSGNALDFDGTDDYLEIPESIDLSASQWAVQMWFNIDTLPSVANDMYLFNPNGATANTPLYLDNDDLVKSFNGSKINSGQSVSTDTWYAVTASHNSGTHTITVDGGANVGSSGSYTFADINQPYRLMDDANRVFGDGTIDEVRISTTDRSADWISSEYSNQNTPTTFYTVGSVQGPSAEFGDNPDGDYADVDWDHRKKITIDSSQVDSELTDFPVYVDLSDLGSNFFSGVKSDGGDIRVTNESGTELAREVVSVDTGSETGELHFKADTIDAFSDTVFYIYYGNTNAYEYNVDDTYGRNAVWSDYEVVYHLNEDPSGTAPQFTDATGNGHNGTAGGTMTSGDSVTGKIGAGIDLDGTDDYIEVPDSDALSLLESGDPAFSVYAWASPDTESTDLQGVVSKESEWSLTTDDKTASNGGLAPRMQQWGDNNLTTVSDSITVGSWNHYAGVFIPGTSAEAFVNGASDGGPDASSNTSSNQTRPLTIGSETTGVNYFDGVLDEARIIVTELSADWISAEYTNQNTPTTFYTVGSQEAPSSEFGDDTDGDYADTDWGYREKITIDSSQVDSTLEDFPVYVDLSDMSSTFFSNVRSDGGDIRVTEGDGTTELSREVVSVDTASSTGELHFKANSISPSTDTSFYIYYGNSNAPDYEPDEVYGAESVWTNDYALVSHDGGGTDSTSNGNNGTAENGVTIGGTSGQIGNATDYDGDDDGVEIPPDSSHELSEAVTVSAWVNFDQDKSSGAKIVTKYWGGSNTGYNYILQADPTVALMAIGVNDTIIEAEGNDIPLDQWEYMTGTYDRSQVLLYENGSQTGSVSESGAMDVDAEPLIIGNSGTSGGGVGTDSTRNFDGQIDEVRISSVARSPDWVSAEHINQSTTTDFYTLDSAQASDTVFGDDPSGDFADTDWNYREKITIDSSNIGSDLTDFPVYVDLSDLSSQFFSNVNSDGGDIRITNTSGTELAREVVSVDTASSTGEIHFKADSISSSNDTTFYIYYGNSNASNYATHETYGRNAVWSDFEAVWHMGTATDSSGNGHSLTTNNGVTIGNATSTQQIGDATVFDKSSNQYLSTGFFPDNSVRGISYWANFKANSLSDLDLSGVHDSGSNQRLYLGTGDSQNNEVGSGYGGRWYEPRNDNLAADTPVLLAMDVADSAPSQEVHVNGDNNHNSDETNGGSTTFSGTSDQEFLIGAREEPGGPNNYIDGTIDEFRLHTKDFSHDYRVAEHLNQSTTTDFYTVGTQESDTTVFGDDPSGDFADTDWQYREKITVDSSNIGSDLTDFPVYVDLSDLSSQFFNNVNSDGGDIRITNATGTELAREVVSVDTASSTGELHFKADSISSSNDTVFYIYYGNSSASDYVASDTYGRNAVWSDYELVMHLNQDPTGTAPQIIDSSGNGNSGTTEGSMTSNDLVSGKLGKAIDFDGSDDSAIIDNGGFTETDSAGTPTIQLWINTNDTNNYYPFSVETLWFFRVNFDSGGEAGVTFTGSSNDLLTGSSVINDGDDHMIHGVYDGSQQHLYVDGQNEGSATETLDSLSGGTEDSSVGENTFNDAHIAAIIDEVRVAKLNRSSNWISAEYTNQSTTTDFYTVGSSQTDTSVFGDDPDGDFADTDWKYREKITIASSSVDSTLKDFPVYVDLSDLSAQFFDNVNSDGSDIRVTTGDGTTEIAREVVSVDTTNEQGELHFKAGTLHAFTDTSFYIYYGNSSASDYVASDTYGTENVWTNGQIGVWHKNEDPSGVAPQILDSTSNVNHGTSSGSMTSADLVSGKVGQAIDYDGTDDFIQIDNPTGLPTGDFTYSAWLYADDDFSEILFMVPDAFGQNEMIVRNNSGLLQTYIDGNLYSFSEADPDTGVWSKIVISRESGTLSAYLDGSLATTSSVTSATLDFSSCPLFLGADSDTECIDGTMGNYQTGIMDEMQIYNRAVSSDWISAEYLNQSTTTDFYTVGTQDAGTIETPNLSTPADEAIDVSRTPTFSWSDLSAASEYQLQVSTDSSFSSIVADETVSTTSVDFGPPYPVLDESQNYYWRVRGVDGSDTGAWSSEFTFVTTTGLAGSGTEADPYLLSTPQDLDDLRNDLTAYYEMANDIDMTFATQNSGGDFWNGGSGWTPVEFFDGEIDMAGYSIVGLAVFDEGFSHGRGLVFRTAENFYIHDGKFVGSKSPDVSDSGAVIGRGQGTVERVAVVDSTIEGADGGRQGQIIGRPNGDVFTLRDSYTVGGQMPGGISNGGLIGRQIMNSTGTTTVDRAFSATQVSPDTTNSGTGGVIGHNGGGNRTGSASFFDGDVMTPAIEKESFVTELTTSGAKDFDTYNNAGWDIVLKKNHDGQKSTATWFIDDGNSYPKLWFEWESAVDNTTFGDDPDGGWADTDWDYREKITIDADRIDATLTDFPVYVDLSDLDPRFFDNLRSDGGDIRVTNASSTELAREIVSVSTDNNTGELHFKADSLSATTDTSFYIYYGNSEAENYSRGDTYGSENVWTNDFAAVYHMDEPTDTAAGTYEILDSTRFRNHGTASSTMGTGNEVAGKLSNSILFDGTDDYISIPDSNVFDQMASSYSFSVWHNIPSLQDKKTLLAKGDGNDHYQTIEVRPDNAEANFWGGNTTNDDWNFQINVASQYSASTWHHTAGTFDSSASSTLYVDGTSVGGDTPSGNVTTNTEPLLIGAQNNNGFTEFWDGRIDEVRIATSSRSAAWVSAEHTNQNTPTAFYSLNDQETPSDDTTAPTPDPMTFSTAPDDASTSSISMTATEASDAYGSVPVEYFFDPQSCTGSDSGNSGSSGSDSGWQESRTYTDTGLQPNKCYGYRVKARDSVGNETSYSSSTEVYTAAAVPDAPSVSEPTQTTLTLSNDENGNPLTAPTTTFAVQISATDPNDGTWDGQYVDSSGSATSTAVWLTDAQIDDLVLGSLQANTTYTFRVKARNEDGDETAWSPTYDGVTREETTTETSSQLRGGSTIRGGGIIR